MAVEGERDVLGPLIPSSDTGDTELSQPGRGSLCCFQISKTWSLSSPSQLCWGSDSKQLRDVSQLIRQLHVEDRGWGAPGAAAREE